jgi:hypothetical protein
MGALSVSAEIAHGVALTEKYQTGPISGQRGKGVFFRADPGFFTQDRHCQRGCFRNSRAGAEKFCF